MPRRQRLQVAGVPVHIILRGNNRQACFFADEDYLFFLDRKIRVGPEQDPGRTSATF
jgi:REP element-mobilizing transposase RayT